jgi:hypothetical protein
MSGDIIRLAGGTEEALATAEFQRIVARTADDFVVKFGRVPTALVFVLSDDQGDVSASWLMRESSEGTTPYKISLASVVLANAVRDQL